MKRKFRDIVVLISKMILASYVLIALAHPLLFNEKPIICRSGEDYVFPVFREMVGRTNSSECTQVILRPPFGYSYDYLDTNIKSLSPPLTIGISGIHWLGTDQVGRDVLAILARGCYVSIFIAFIALFFSILIGSTIGMLAGLFGNHSLRINILQIIVVLFTLVFWVYYSIYSGWFSAYTLASLVIGIVLLILLSRFPYGRMAFPLDKVVMTFIEWMKSIPTLIWLLILLPILGSGSIWSVILVLIFVGWTRFARHVRAEVLSLKEEQYILSAKASGASTFRIMTKHLMPNSLTTIRALSAAIFVQYVMAEATLSFLGLGLAVGEVSWGQLLAVSKTHLSSWWLSIFPALAMMVFIICVHVIKFDFQTKKMKNAI